MGYEQNDITAGRSALEARARAIEGISNTAANMNEAVSRNLQNIGNSIMQYAAFREQLDKNARDEAFRQKELDTKSEQFNKELALKEKSHAEIIRQWNEGEALRKAQEKAHLAAANESNAKARASNFETKNYEIANKQIANATNEATKKAKELANGTTTGQGGTTPTNDNTTTKQNTNIKSQFARLPIVQSLKKKLNLAQPTEDTLTSKRENSVLGNV